MPTYCNQFYELYKKGITEEFKVFIENYGMNCNWSQLVVALSLDENYNIVENDYLIEIVKNTNYDKKAF